MKFTNPPLVVKMNRNMTAAAIPETKYGTRLRPRKKRRPNPTWWRVSANIIDRVMPRVMDATTKTRVRHSEFWNRAS